MARRKVGPAPQGGSALKTWTDQILRGGSLSSSEAASVAEELLSSKVADEDKADFLAAMHRRGETPDEIQFFATSFLRHAEPFEVHPDLGPVLDVCGTGGDKLGLFNVSTAVMFVAAGAGARVVKHGNRGITSKSGGADVLEALGISIDAPLDRLHGMLEESGATFLFAPRFHPSFKAVASARKLLAQRGDASIFNMLGPLLNPARPAYQLTGVFSENLLPLYAQVLPKLGRRRAWVVHGKAGPDAVMDEISTLGPTRIVDVGPDGASEKVFSPEDLGVPFGDLSDLRGGDAMENAELLTQLLKGHRQGSARDLVIVNAAASILVTGLTDDWVEAKERAEESIDSGKAIQVLLKMRRASSQS